jgi:hypothetical protein
MRVIAAKVIYQAACLQVSFAFNKGARNVMWSAE